MDNLTARALQNQSNANANYNAKLKREEETKALTEAPAFVTGFEGGKYQLERLGQDPVADGVPMTNGLLEVRRRVTTTGQYVDGMPRVKPIAPVVKPVEAGGKIKYLYTTIDADGQTLLYVGGWKRTPALVRTFAAGEFLRANLDNLGGDRWRVDYIIQSGGSFFFQSSDSDTAPLAIPAPNERLTFYGYGLTQISRTIVRTSTILPEPGDNPAVSSSTDALAGVFVVGKKLVSSSGSGTSIGTVESYLADPIYSKTTSSTSVSESPIPLTNTLSSTDSRNSGGVRFEPSSAGASSQYFNGEIVTLTRSRGDRSIGVLSTYAPSGAEINTPCWIEDSVQPAVGVVFGFPGSLDVQSNGFTRFTLKPFTPQQQEQTVEVEQYAKTFVKSAQTIKVKVLKPPTGTQPFSPSYHA